MQKLIENETQISLEPLRRRRILWGAAARALLVTLPLVALLAGCNYGGAGIFYSIENEKKVTNASNLANDLVTGSLVEYNNSPVNALYVASGTVSAIDYTEATTSTSGTWNSVGSPDSTRTWCTQVAVATDTNTKPALFALYSARDGSQGSVYTAQPSNSSSPQSVSWSPISSFSFGSGSSTVAEAIYSAGPTLAPILFVVEMADTGSGFSYSLYSWNASGADSNTILVQGGLGGPVVGVVWDGTEYWFASGASLYKATYSGGATGTWTVTKDPNAPVLPAGSLYGGIFWTASGGGTLFLSTRSLTASTGAGYVYARSGSQSSSSWVSNSSPIAYNLNGFGEITSIAGLDVVLVGADQGYYELDLSGSGWNGSVITPTTSGSVTTDTNYVNIALKTSAVGGFLIPAANPLFVFAFSTHGLWINNEPSSGYGTWEPE